MKRPNIVFLHVDQLSMFSIASYANGQFPLGALSRGRVATPHMDRIVSSGVSFMQSCCTNPVCMPARTSWYTGLMSEEHGQLHNGAEWECLPELPDLGPWLRKAGYDSVYAGKWHITKPLGQSFDVLHTGDGYGELGDAVVARVSEAFLRNRRSEKPFFLNVGLLNPHDICYWTFNPCGPGQFDFAPHIKDDLPPLPPNHGVTLNMDPANRRVAIKRPMAGRTGLPADKETWTEMDWRFYAYSYNRHVEMVDEMVGKVFDAYRDTGAEDTIFIFASDHGEAAGQHFHLTKGTLYDHCALVPLVVIDPAGVIGALDTEHMVSAIDVAATICDYADIEPMPRTRGLSLRPLARGESPKWRPYAAASTQMANHRMIRTPNLKLIHERTSNLSCLFDLEKDPWEMSNVAGDSDYAGRLAELETFLEENEAQNEYAPKVKERIAGLL